MRDVIGWLITCALTARFPGVRALVSTASLLDDARPSRQFVGFRTSGAVQDSEGSGWTAEPNALGEVDVKMDAGEDGLPRTVLETELQRTGHAASLLAEDAAVLAEEIRSLETLLHSGLGRVGYRRAPSSKSSVSRGGLLSRSSSLLSLPPLLQGGGGAHLPGLQDRLEWEEADEKQSGKREREELILNRRAGLIAQERGSLSEAALLSVSAAPSSASVALTPAPSASPIPADVSSEDMPLEEAEDEESQAVPVRLGSVPTLAPTSAPALHCGGSRQPECSSLMRVLTMDYRFTVFWSCIHWSVILLMALVVCWCCHMCSGHRDHQHRRRSHHGDTRT